MNGSLDLNDGGDIRLPRASAHGFGGIEHADDPRFMTVAFVRIDCLHAGKGFCVFKRGFDLPAQRHLIFFQLDDEMRPLLARRFQTFFLSIMPNSSPWESFFLPCASNTYRLLPPRLNIER